MNVNSDVVVKKSISTSISEYFTMLLVAVGIVGITSWIHSIGIPLYKINPMHWVIYGVILVKKPSLSSITLLAIALPLTSNILTGHPILIKSLVIAIELIFYGALFNILQNRLFVINAYLLSQLAGHLFYYSCKYILIQTGLLNSVIVSASIIIQIIVFILLGLSIFIISSLQQNKMNKDNSYYSK